MRRRVSFRNIQEWLLVQRHRQRRLQHVIEYRIARLVVEVGDNDGAGFAWCEW